jgi:hypothetical protein
MSKTKYEIRNGKLKTLYGTRKRECKIYTTYKKRMLKNEV